MYVLSTLWYPISSSNDKYWFALVMWQKRWKLSMAKVLDKLDTPLEVWMNYIVLLTTRILVEEAVPQNTQEWDTVVRRNVWMCSRYHIWIIANIAHNMKVHLTKRGCTDYNDKYLYFTWRSNQTVGSLLTARWHELAICATTRLVCRLSTWDLKHW